MHHLTSSVRHASDPVYLRFLSTIRFRRPSQSEIDEVLSEYFMAEKDTIARANETTTVLCTHNQDVDRLNKAILHHLFPENEIVSIPLCTAAPFESFSKNWILDEKLYTLSKVAVGAAVIVTGNINLKASASNGARGIVEEIVQINGKVEKIVVRLCSTDKLVSVRSRSKAGNLCHNAKQFTKHAFALRLAYALTCYKSQGATIANDAIIHVRDSFRSGLLYVMLSRVTERKLIKLLTPLTPKHFRPVVVAGCVGLK
jgi:ATP-dependent exoDNAse (exonuclease V) alpha subunit